MAKRDSVEMREMKRSWMPSEGPNKAAAAQVQSGAFLPHAVNAAIPHSFLLFSPHHKACKISEYGGTKFKVRDPIELLVASKNLGYLALSTMQCLVLCPRTVPSQS